MSDDPISPADHDDMDLPAGYQQFAQVFKDFRTIRIDTSWLDEYGMDAISRWEEFCLYKVFRFAAKEGWSQDQGELLLYAKSIARARSRVLAACRKEEFVELSSMLHLVTEEAYERGVRDAVEERLSSKSIRRFAQRADAGDQRFEAMMEFSDSLQDL